MDHPSRLSPRRQPVQEVLAPRLDVAAAPSKQNERWFLPRSRYCHPWPTKHSPCRCLVESKHAQENPAAPCSTVARASDVSPDCGAGLVLPDNGIPGSVCPGPREVFRHPWFAAFFKTHLGLED